MASLKVAVTTTVSLEDRRLSASLSSSTKVGAVPSKVKVILSVPVYTLPASSVPLTVNW